MSSHPHSTPQRPHIEVGKTPAGRMLSSIARRVTQWRTGHMINNALKNGRRTEPSARHILRCQWRLADTEHQRQPCGDCRP